MLLVFIHRPSERGEEMKIKQQRLNITPPTIQSIDIVVEIGSKEKM